MRKHQAPNLKIRIIYIIFFSFFLLLVFGCVRWQIINAEELKALSDARLTSKELNSLRGTIYSSDGTTLATSVPSFDMFVWVPDLEYLEEKNLQTREEFLKKVSKIIDKTSEQLGKDIDNYQKETNSRWIPIATNLSSDQRDALNKLTTNLNPERKLSGFKLEYKSKRLYPEATLAAHVIGLTNFSKEGMLGTGGLEGYWDGDLNPTKGIEIKDNDVLGRAVASSLFATTEPKEGSSLFTTIDIKLQKMIENKLKESVEKYEAKSGNIIIMDPKTGAVKAYANYPTYNPNTRTSKDPGVFTDRSLTSPYEVGSVAKIMTLAIGIDKGLVTPNSVVIPKGHQGCEKYPGWEKFAPGEPKDTCTWDRKPQPAMNLRTCFIKSDNICFYNLAKKFKKDDWYEYLQKFGVGSSTGIDLMNDDSGILPPPSSWKISDVATISYGHGMLMTPMQVVDFVATIANKGVRMKPYVVDKVVKGDGEVKVQKPVVLDRVVSKKTSTIISDVMHDAFLGDIREWEFWFHHLRNYDIGVKSGTALIAEKGNYTSDINATYVGFDKSPERKFVMLVRLERPKIGALSFYNVRPMWLETFDLIKNHLGLKPR